MSSPGRAKISPIPRREFLLFGIILLVGLSLRVIYMRENMAKPEFSVPPIDAGFHDYWARALATGDWAPPYNRPDPEIQNHAFLRPPGYPYLLSLVYRICGTSYVAPRLFQHALGLVNCGLAFVIGRRWFGSTVGLVWSLLMSVYWIFIYYEGELQEPTALMLLLLLFVWVAGRWLEKPSGRRAVIAGLVLGLATIFRANVLLFVPVVLCWGYWILKRKKAESRRWLQPCGLLLGVGVAVVPVTLRNVRVAGDYVLISANAGINLYIGNHEGSDGRFVGTLPGLGPFGTCFDYPGIVRNLERITGRPMKHSEVSSWFTMKALQFIREYPDRFVSLTIRKALLFWYPTEISHNKMVNCERAQSGLLRNIPLNFLAAVALFGVGLYWAHKDANGEVSAAGTSDPAVSQGRNLLLLAVLFVGTYFVSYLPFFSTALYRVPIIPFLLLFGSYGLARIARSIWSGESRLESFISAVVIILCASLGRGSQPHPFDQAKWRSDRGAAYMLSGNSEDAKREYRTALEHNPELASCHYNLSLVHKQLGETEDAIAECRKYVEQIPQDSGGYSMLLELFPEAGLHEEAKAALESGLALPVTDPFLMARSASFLSTCPRMELRDLPRALELAEKACRLTERRRPEVLLALTEALAANGKAGRALATAQEALALARTMHRRDLAEEIASRIQSLESASDRDSAGGDMPSGS